MKILTSIIVDAVIRFNVTSIEDWRTKVLSKEISNEPLEPENICSDWTSWSDVFEEAARRRKSVLNYDSCRELAIKHGLQSKSDWIAAKENRILPLGAPLDLESSFPAEWKGWRRFLGQRSVSVGEYVDFETARSIVCTLELSSYRAWLDALKDGYIPINIPSDPARYYAKRWLGWANFLGNDNKRGKNSSHVTYDVARAHAISLNLKTVHEFREYVAEHGLPDRHPHTPQTVYKDVFKKRGGWRYFLGNDFMSFDQAKKFIATKGLQSFNEYRAWAKSSDRPKNFPSQPHSYRPYEPYWIDYPDFLGYGGKQKTKGVEQRFDDVLMRIEDFIQQYPEILDNICTRHNLKRLQ